MLTNSEVLKQNPTLSEYQVCLVEDEGITNTIFYCFADSVEHAYYQALNAYPVCHIKTIRAVPTWFAKFLARFFN